LIDPPRTVGGLRAAIVELWPARSTDVVVAPATPTVALPERPSLRRKINWGAVACAGLSALILGGMLHWRYGYSAGFNDHLVLSPVGRQWANPDEFAGDWAVANAPQPHWLFDMVTWFGATIGHLGAVYLAYWLLGLAVFGVATTMLARRWAPAHPVVATVVVTVLGSITPWWLLGTGSPMLAIALPVVLAGFLIYLTVAALLTDRRRLAAVSAVATALVHVQQGGVVGVLLLAVVLLTVLRAREIDWLLLGAGALCLTIMLVTLSFRPVAGHLSDFAQVCTQLIPMHCEATVWTPGRLRGGFALLGLAMLTCVYVPVEQRIRWALLLVLPAFGLTCGVLADRWNVPVLGMLAQGLNIYRLAVVLLPFAIWGVLAPVFGRLVPWRRPVLLLLVLLLGYRAISTPDYAAEYPLETPAGGRWMLLLVVGLGVACLAVTGTRLAARASLLVRAGAVGIVAAVLASISANDAVVLHRFEPRLFSGGDLVTWGEAVRKAVPPGSQLAAAPLATYVRAVTGRGVIADCKYGPYGGAPWREYVARIDALGGFAQCSSYNPNYFDDLPPQVVAATAKRYGADYLVVEATQQDRLPILRAHGWTVVLGPVNSLENWILKAPWAR
jgi:hypothetical protein